MWDEGLEIKRGICNYIAFLSCFLLSNALSIIFNAFVDVWICVFPNSDGLRLISTVDYSRAP